MKRFLSRLIENIENTPLTLATFGASFLTLIILRLTIENAVAFFETRTFFFLFFEFTHTFLFFLCSFLILLPVVRFAGQTDIKKSTNVLLFGFFIILSPPLIDTLIFKGHFWSFYAFDGFFGLLHRFITLFGDSPELGITYGVRVEVVLVTFALGIYSYIKTKNLLKTLGVSLLTYIILFILGTFPSWLTLGILSFQKSFFAISGNDVAAIFLSPETILARQLNDFRSVLNFKMSVIYGALAVLLTGFLLLKEFPKYFWALWKNARMPQLVYHGGLLFLGLILSALFNKISFTFDFFHIIGFLVLLAAVESAWIASVIVNDLYDMNIDVLTNPARPLIEKTIPPDLYKIFAALFFFASLLLSGIISFKAALLLLAYQALAFAYSAWPFRLKRVPFLATLIAAAAGLLVLLTGYYSLSPESDLQNFPLSLLVFLFAAYALSLPVKDFKDIAGDKKDGVYTLPVLLGAYMGKLVIGSFLFLFYVASPFILHARALFFPALFFGSLSFIILQKGTSHESSFFAWRKLPGILIAVTLGYGLILTYILF